MAMWRKTSGNAPLASATAQHMMRLAQILYEIEVKVGGIAESKGCLRKCHDKFLDIMNDNYWKAVN
tara:strand:+ start:4994 stop:5191 length:198 start_codon:yes stop_codon:yes gene_type:complete